MLEWFWFSLPWEVKLGLFATIAATIYVMGGATFGFQKMHKFIIPLVALVVTFGLVNKFQKEGWDARVKKDLAIADKHIERARRTRAAADRDAAADGGLRSDDEFKRRPRGL